MLKATGNATPSLKMPPNAPKVLKSLAESLGLGGDSLKDTGRWGFTANTGNGHGGARVDYQREFDPGGEGLEQLSPDHLKALEDNGCVMLREKLEMLSRFGLQRLINLGESRLWVGEGCVVCELICLRGSWIVIKEIPPTEEEAAQAKDIQEALEELRSGAVSIG